ncbi:MAG: formate dehydrogenase accessory sulfurtransferase FdhD [Desulfuromonadales bacterium]|nr:formate dehydrogenase accessory sulfurtransferase FdhD [Desulfuromonadales bacterium]
MTEKKPQNIYQLKNGRLHPAHRHVVEEYPLRLRVNGRELATLICSPHQLNFLLVGFFRLQGFVESLDDIQSLGICADFGLAEVRLKGELPAELQPTLTSGCGTGISYNLPRQLRSDAPERLRKYTSDSLFRLMSQLAKQAEQYRSHGGIHSAAIGDENGLLLFAEDIGRHNTFDRLAGEAWFKGIELHNKMLVTSGRVSTEMVAKAARLGIGLIASRTSATDKAIKLCEQAGITLIGYLRGETLEVYSRPQQLQITTGKERIADITGVILAGGESRRMGSDKSLLPFRGARFIDHTYRTMAELFTEVIIVTNSPDLYNSIPCRKVPDIYSAQGSLAGIHSGLCHAGNDTAFIVACDMPFINPEAITQLCNRATEGDVVIPIGTHGPEPLHALYNKRCIPAMENALDAGKKRIVGFFSQVTVIEVTIADLSPIDPDEQSFLNVNTPQEYFSLRDNYPPSSGEDTPYKRKKSD